MKRFSLFIALILSQACVEPIELFIPNRKTMVIEASITNEMKKQEVLLSLPYTFENGTVATVEGASIKIMGDNGHEYGFSEIEPGRYLSADEFAVEAGVAYMLLVTTKDGKSYHSSAESFQSEASIDDLVAQRTTNFDGQDGILISAKGTGVGGEFFKYTYEETYKIIAPKYIGLDFQLTNYDPCTFPITFDLEIVPREEQKQVCYGYRQSTEIIQASTELQSENNIGRYPVKFIPADDFVLSHRYSILVKQHVQSADAYSYYSTLKNMSTSENLFSDIQPGFLEGNLRSDEDENELVLGFFEVTSVSSKRLFFDYEDFFSNEPLPDYPIDCDNSIIWPMLVGDAICEPGDSFPHFDCGRDLLQLIDGDLVAYLTNATVWGECQGPYKAVPKVCGDCTLLGSNLVPEFWTE